MIQIKDLHENEGAVVSGHFMLTDCLSPPSKGVPRQQLTVHDGTGQATGFIWPEYQRNTAIPALPAAVHLRAQVRMFSNRPQLHIHSLRATTPDEVKSASALLPVALCPEIARPALAELVTLEASLEPPLDGFLRRTLLDPRIGLPLLTCRASVNHHHAYQGGLLVHTMECVALTTAAIKHFLPRDPQSVAIGSLSQLFHDIGKLCSVGDTHRPRFPFAMRHELHTIRLLEPHLAWLAQHSLDLSAAFEYVLDYLATPHSIRKPAKYLVAEIIVAIDQWSAASQNDRCLSSLLGALNPACSSIAANDDEAAKPAAPTQPSRRDVQIG